MKNPLIIALMLAAAACAADETPAPAFVLKDGGQQKTGDFVVGYQFTLDKPMTVTALGVTDQNKDGKLNESTPVKIAIWDHTRKEMVSAEVPLTTTVENGVFYVGVTPLELKAGSYVIGSLIHAGGEGFLFDSPVEAVPGIRWDEGRFGPGDALVLPTKKRPVPSGYFGPVFKVLGAATASKPAVPEATTESEPSKPSSALSVTQPTERAIYQRKEKGLTEVPLAVTLAGVQADRVEVRVLNRQNQSPLKNWEKVTAGMKLALPAGWYQLEFRAMKAGSVVATAGVERVGVGEVFVTCGQSNSANHGKPPQKAEDDRVSSCNFENGAWQHSDDPQPGASGAGGSPWALLGDLLVKKYDVPVGFICVGVGGTPVAYWKPVAKGSKRVSPGHARLQQAMQLAGAHGCRAILWHQGETDSIKGTSAEKYAEMLSEAIDQSRKDVGWKVPWGVALASFHPSPHATAERQAAVVEGQRKVIASVAGVFEGPETDSFHTRGFLGDSVHFNAKGLAAHAQGWAEALEPILNSSSGTATKTKR